jgi:hypothetical protein
MQPIGLHLILTPKRCFFFFFNLFFFILYSYKYLYYYILYIILYICSRLSVITAFFKSLKPLTATDLFGYLFLITNYKIGYRFVGYYRLSVVSRL